MNLRRDHCVYRTQTGVSHRRRPRPSGRGGRAPRRRQPPARAALFRTRAVCLKLCRSDRSDATGQLSTTDILAPATMKNAAKRDTWCELQNSANHRVFERTLRPRTRPQGTPASAPASISSLSSHRGRADLAVPLPPRERVCCSAEGTARADSRAGRAGRTASRRRRLPLGLRRAPSPWSPLARHTKDRARVQTRPPAQLKHISRRRKRN